MPDKTDLRIIKTNTSLTNAFYELLSEKKFEDITVTELCNRALIRRATFYKHFTDKNDFFTFVVRNLVDQYSNTYEVQPHQIKPISFYLSITKNILHFLSEREKMVRSLAASNMYSTLMDIFYIETGKEVQSYLEEDEKNGAVLPASAEITAHFFTGAMVSCIRYWFVSDHRLSEDQLLEQLGSLLYAFSQHSTRDF